MSTLEKARMRAETRRGSLRFEIRFRERKENSIEIVDWCDKTFGDCHLLWSEDLPGRLYSFNCKKDAMLFSLRWL